MNNYHIKPHPDGWALEKQGADRATKVSPTKQDAIAHMREFMVGKVGSVKIHNQNGRIEEERTYPRSKDPSRSPG